MEREIKPLLLSNDPKQGKQSLSVKDRLYGPLGLDGATRCCHFRPERPQTKYQQITPVPVELYLQNQAVHGLYFPTPDLECGALPRNTI